MKRAAIIILVVLIGLFSASWYSLTWAERFLGPVKVGMGSGKVESLVGLPLKVAKENGTESWHYSRWWSGDAVVYFDDKNFVSAIETD